MDDNTVNNAKLKILEDISEFLGGCLHTDRYGLIMKHMTGTIRWIQMDLQTCALIFNINPEHDLSFNLEIGHSEPFYHSLFLSEGNVIFSGFAESGNLNIMPREFLFFHTLSHTLNIKINKGKNCQLVLISHSVANQGNLFAGFRSKSNLNLGSCAGDSLAVLNTIFTQGIKAKASFELKGSLFLLLAKTLPICYNDSADDNKMDGKPTAAFSDSIQVGSKRQSSRTGNPRSTL